MAWFFNLAAGFDKNEKDARDFLDYFDNFNIILSTKNVLPVKQEINFTKTEGWIVGVYPHGMSYGTSESDYNLIETDLYFEIQNMIYDTLKDAPYFLYAQFGAEIHDRFLDEEDSFRKDLEKDPEWNHAGLVLYKDLWEKINKPKHYQYFKPDYYWISPANNRSS
jgi:hypothetical protein